MRTKHLIPVILLLCGLMLLSACAPAAPTEEPQQQPAVETPDPDLAPDESQGGSIPYPYPAPQEPQEAIDPYPAPNEVQEAYPGPQEILPVWDPYPSVEIVDDASERDFSEALGPDEFEVLPGDEALISDLVYIEISQINIKDGDPAPVDLILSGNLPTPCAQLRVVRSDIEVNGSIDVQVYSVSDPDTVCALVLEPFTAVVPLGTFSQGTYSISINDQINGEFAVP